MTNEKLAEVLIQRSYLTRRPDEKPFILASGKPSYHYFDCERTTSFAPAMPMIAQAFYLLLEPGVRCVGGPTRGADPIADAIAYYSVLQSNPLHVFSIRREKKTHGIEGWIEGSAQPGDRVVFVDDVVTSGRSVIDGLKRCQEAGLEVIQVLVFVDREEQNGMEKIRDFDPALSVQAIFRYSELMERVNGDSRLPRSLAGAI